MDHSATLSPRERAAFDALWHTLHDEAVARDLSVEGVVAVIEAVRDELQRRVARLKERQGAHVDKAHT